MERQLAGPLEAEVPDAVDRLGIGARARGPSDDGAREQDARSERTPCRHAKRRLGSRAPGSVFALLFGQVDRFRNLRRVQLRDVCDLLPPEDAAIGRPRVAWVYTACTACYSVAHRNTSKFLLS